MSKFFILYKIVNMYKVLNFIISVEYLIEIVKRKMDFFSDFIDQPTTPVYSKFHPQTDQ